MTNLISLVLWKKLLKWLVLIKNMIPLKRKTILPAMTPLKIKRITNPKTPLKMKESPNAGNMENLVTGVMNVPNPKIKLGNWIANPHYLKEQPLIIWGRPDDQFSTSKTRPDWVNWSDPPNGGRQYKFDPRAGGRQFNLAEMVIYCSHPFLHIITPHILWALIKKTR